VKLNNEFEVPVGVDRVWEVLVDVERVAPCLPGATIEGQDGDTYRGAMKIKLGPITSTYKGTVKIEEADEAARRAVMRAQAKDARGQGTAAATITSTMESTGDGTKVNVETDMRVTGPAAQFGRGVMQDVSAKLMRQFADCLAERITSGQEAPAATAEPVPTPEPAAATPASEAPTEPSGAPALVPPGAPRDDNGAAAGAAAPSPAPAGATAAGATGPAGASAGPTPAGTNGGPGSGDTSDVLDLGAASREAILKRAVPVAGGLLLALVLLRILRRR
jgi:carbon monoxide dehydrogenase subunit G